MEYRVIMVAFLIVYAAIGFFVSVSIMKGKNSNYKNSLTPRADKSLEELAAAIAGIAVTSGLFVVTAIIASFIKGL